MKYYCFFFTFVDMRILIADSGSTKTDWAYLDHTNTKRFTTQGLNPNHLTHDEIKQILLSEVAQHVDIHQVQKVYFYGAGLGNADAKHFLQAIFEKIFTDTVQITLAHDVLGAAQALYKVNEQGIVCILGTGSIAGFFDGHSIIKTAGGLGYLLGDEGSGTYMGKLLVAEYAQQKLSPLLEEALYEQVRIKSTEILHFLYKNPYPNRFLAQLTYFLTAFRQESEIKNIIQTAFGDFYQHTLSYLLSLYPECKSIRCVGSVAYLFEQELRQVMNNYGIIIDKIIQKPIEGLSETFRSQIFTQ